MGTDGRIGMEIMQGPKTNAAIGDPAQLFQCIAQALHRRTGKAGQGQGISRGKPTHGAVEVDSLNERLPTITFKLDPQRALARPLGDGCGQGGQEHRIQRHGVQVGQRAQQLFGLGGGKGNS